MRIDRRDVAAEPLLRKRVDFHANLLIDVHESEERFGNEDAHPKLIGFENLSDALIGRNEIAGTQSE